MPYKIIETFSRFIENLSESYHVKPGDLLITQLVPALPPYRFTERGLVVGANTWRNQLRTVSYSLKSFISICIRSAICFVLCFCVNQQNFSVPDQRHIQVISARG